MLQIQNYILDFKISHLINLIYFIKLNFNILISNIGLNSMNVIILFSVFISIIGIIILFMKKAGEKLENPIAVAGDLGSIYSGASQFVKDLKNGGSNNNSGGSNNSSGSNNNSNGSNNTNSESSNNKSKFGLLVGANSLKKKIISNKYLYGFIPFLRS